MTTEGERAAAEIRDVFEAAITAGLRRDAFAGASDAEIPRFIESQQVSQVPTATREVFRFVDKKPDLWLSGSSFGTQI